MNRMTVHMSPAEVERFKIYLASRGKAAGGVVGQSRRASFVESLINVAIGLTVAFVTQLVLFPALGIRVELHQNMEISAVFTVVSVARSYCVRRGFNWWHHRKAA